MSLADLTATELLSKYRDGTLSPVEVIEDVLARVEELEPRICAVRGVSTIPGATAFTRTPEGPSSAAAVRSICTSPALVAA